MRCKACDCLLGDHGDPELCDDCLTTIKPDYEVPMLPRTDPNPDPDWDDVDLV